MSAFDPNLSSYLPILVVDANEPVADQLASHLREHGFRVEVATSCWMAQAAVRRSMYGTLVVAANLHQPVDLECLANLRKKSPRSWLVAINLQRDFDARDVVLACGADACLSVPFSLADLLHRLSAFARCSRPA